MRAKRQEKVTPTLKWSHLFQWPSCYLGIIKAGEKNVSSLHMPCWLRQLVQWANTWCSENFLQRHFLDVMLSCVARRRNYTAGSSSLRWNEFKCVMNCCDPFRKRGPLPYWTDFLCFIALFLIANLNWGRIVQAVIHLPHAAVLAKKKTTTLPHHTQRK